MSNIEEEIVVNWRAVNCAKARLKRVQLKNERLSNEAENKVFDDILLNLRKEKAKQKKLLEIKRIQDEVNKIKQQIMDESQNQLPMQEMTNKATNPYNKIWGKQ